MLRYKLTHILNKGKAQDRVMCEYILPITADSREEAGNSVLRHSDKAVLWLSSQCD